MKKLSVSVAICTYNGEKYIEEQLKSIINQTHPVDEIVIVDDRSTDKSIQVCERVLAEFEGEYRIVVNLENMKPGRSFEKCILLCKNEVIFTADQDDVWEANKVERMLKEFYDNPKCMLAFSDAYVVDKELNVIDNSAWNALCLPLCGIDGKNTTEIEYKKAIMYQTVVFGNMMAFRKELAEKILPMPHDKGWLHDNWFGICAPIYGDVVLIEEKLIYYRQHDNNACGISSKWNTPERKNVYHIQRVLLYIRQNEAKLKVFLNANRQNMDEEYIALVEMYIRLYEKMQTYIDISTWKKIVYLIKLLFVNQLSEFLVSRKDILLYIKYYMTQIK